MRPSAAASAHTGRQNQDSQNESNRLRVSFEVYTSSQIEANMDGPATKKARIDGKFDSESSSALSLAKSGNHSDAPGPSVTPSPCKTGQIKTELLPSNTPPSVIEQCDSVVLQRTALILGSWTSPPWDPVLFPEASTPFTDPPERTLRYRIRPSPPENVMARAVFEHFMRQIRTKFDKDPALPNFRNENFELQFPMVTEALSGGLTYIDVCFKTFHQAAACALLCKYFMVTVPTRRGLRDSSLTLHRTGVVHDPKLLTVILTPHVKEGVAPSTTPRPAYAQAVVALQKTLPAFTLLGAWQDSFKSDSTIVQYLPKAYCTFEIKDAVQLDKMPGFISFELPAPVSPSEPTRSADLLVFRLSFRGRRGFCSKCLTLVHPPAQCPRIECRKCRQIGHIASNCPFNGRNGTSSGRGGRNGRRDSVRRTLSLRRQEPEEKLSLPPFTI